MYRAVWDVALSGRPVELCSGEAEKAKLVKRRMWQWPNPLHRPMENVILSKLEVPQGLEPTIVTAQPLMSRSMGGGQSNRNTHTSECAGSKEKRS